MPYSAEISRNNPACIVLLVDQSASMAGVIGGGGGESKADSVARSINQLLSELSIRCTKEDGVRDYFHIAAIGYGGEVGPALGGPLAGRDIVGISEIADNPLRIEELIVKFPDEDGKMIDRPKVEPVWLEPAAAGGTPMTSAFTYAEQIVSQWTETYPGGFPPIVLNLTDGESTDGDPTAAAAAIRAKASSDGAALLLNLHVSSTDGKPLTFPDSDDQLPDSYSKSLFAISSPLPSQMYAQAAALGYRVSDMSRGFVYNADIQSLTKFLDIGTRTADFR